jgi:hypothetical protein
VAKPIRIPLSRIRFAERQVPCGLNNLRVNSFWFDMLYTTVDYDPIKVRVREDGDFDLVDGRHRWVAALGAGRQDILAELE